MEQFLNCNARRPRNDNRPPRRRPPVNVDAKNGSAPARGNDNNLFGFLSQHAVSLVVAVLFLATLVTLSVYLQTHEEPDPAVISIFSTVLVGLIAYFAATRRNGQHK